MVLPAKELPSTLRPFTVLTPEEDEGIERQRRRGVVGGAGENGKFDGNKYKSNTINIASSKRNGRGSKQPLLHHQAGSSSTLSRLHSLSPPPPILPIQSVETTERPRIVHHHHQQQQQQPHNLQITGTTTLGEGRENEEEIEKRLVAAAAVKTTSAASSSTTNEVVSDSGNNNNNNNKSNCDYDPSYDGSSNKILNLLNARNSSFLSNASSVAGDASPCKISEDELLSDLKSRFLEKHFRTILRSQQSKESRIFGGDSNTDTLPVSQVKTVNNSRNGVSINSNNYGNSSTIKSGKNGATKDSPSDNNNHHTLLKSLKFVTVDRPEPTLDLPRMSYFKSTKQKLIKMHDQAKLRVVERYQKLCDTLRTTVWPQLHPVQVMLEVLLSNVFMLFVAPFVMCAVILLCLVRICVEAVLKIRYKGRFTLMSGSDAAWAHQSFANDSSFLSLYVIQGDCSISRIRERIMKSVINCQDPQYPGKMTYSRLRCRITEKFGFYCWEALHPMDFSIDDHVRYITNDPSAVLTQEQVLREIQKFIDQPLPEDQPQWQILVVPKFLYNRDFYPINDDLEDDGFGNFDTITVKKKPNKNNNNFYTGNHYYALVWRINHALMDGISAANCLQHCIADMPVKLTVDPLQSINVSVGLKIAMYLKMFVFGSRSLLRSMLQRDLNCFHGPGLTGPKNLAWSRGISLQAVKSIRKKNDGATTTAVLATAVGSSLRGLALRKNNPVPKEIRAGVTCALLPYPNIRPQNRFTVAHLKLKLEADTHKERLMSANKAANELVRSADVIKNFGLIRMVGLVPKKAIPWFMDNLEATVLISNIPGPTEEYTIFQGQKLVDIIGWNTIKGNTAIGVCVFSYAGRIRAGVIADGAVLPSSTDVPGLIEEFEKDIVSMAKDADLKEKDVFIDAL